MSFVDKITLKNKIKFNWQVIYNAVYITFLVIGFIKKYFFSWVEKDGK